MTSQSVFVYSAIVFALIVSDVYCRDATSFINNKQPILSNNNTNNPWQKLPSQNPVNPSWGNPISGAAATTPWPALGARQSVNQNQQVSGQNQNRNIGVDLSYGLNPKPNQNAFTSGNRNIGVDLSYGLNPSQGVQTPTAGINKNPWTQNKPAVGVGDVNQQKVSPPPGNVNQKGQNVDNTNQKQQSGTVKLSEDDELREFSEVLLKKDVNNAAKYVTVNYQGKTTSRSTIDEAPEPLMSISSEAFDIPTVARMMLLHNNYILETNVNEHVTPQERIEESNFLDEILPTSVMQHARNFLIQKGKIGRDPKDFKDKLKEIWFNMYSRGKGKIGSSGFEHVFLAEIKGDEVTGLHNWLYFNEAESKKQANYLGYMKKLEFGNKGAILKYHFQLAGKDKPVGSMFIGTSPEFEVALYSTCFILRADKICPLRLGGKNFIVRTFTFRYRGKNMIGSAFPEI